jgi:hypothetical protein
MVVRMNALLTYRGRTVTDEDLAFLQKLIADQPTLSRKAISQQVCQAWNWRQLNGVLKEAVCRGLLLRLHREGHLQLPAPRHQHTNLAGWHRRALTVPIDRTPIESPWPTFCRSRSASYGARTMSRCSKPCCTSTTSWVTRSRLANT